MADGIPGLRVDWVCIDCNDPGTLSQWWQSLLGGQLSVDSDGDVRLEIDGGPKLLFVGVPESPDAKQAGRAKNPLHLDLEASDYAAAVKAALELGATKADDIFVTDRWQVLRDPEGNEFCIVRPRA